MLEQRRLIPPARWRVAEVPVRLRGSDTAARCPLEIAVLDEEGLVHFLDRARILTDRRGNVGDPDRTAVVLLDDHPKDARIHVVEPDLIDVEELEESACEVARDD